MSKLVIVESPAKAKTIRKYLGDGYEVIASMGHIRDLPSKDIGIDIQHGFTPRYLNIPGKGKLIKEIKAAADNSECVYLATDPDREGEAISWHLAHILKMDPSQNNRVTFDEITRKGIATGMAAPRSIDMDLVDAQQARRVLDRLVGYKLSPFLWRKVKPGLSAGRVQSVAVRLIVDREREIEGFKPEEYWNLDAVLSADRSRRFTAHFWGIDGKKVALQNKVQTDAVIAGLQDAVYRVARVTEGKRRKTPAAPFITSTLQQEASRRLGFTAARTMRAAQSLYEGVELAGHGTTGLITYMRTDSLRLSDEAVGAARSFIAGQWGEKYLPAAPRKFKGRASAQDAHEAVRPTNPALTPDIVEQSISGDQAKLYRLIWNRFIACQMADCLQDTVSVDVQAGSCLFKASGYRVTFDGFTVLYEEAQEEKTQKEENMLPPLTEGETLRLHELKGEQKFTQPPARYSEASLIKALEENGIGRPSTYAPIISTVLDRGYVERDKKQLRPTQLGIVVNDLMREQFPDIVDVKFSAQMESNLDTVEQGKSDWHKIIADFYEGFARSLAAAEENMDGQKVRVPDVETDEVCELCGRHMVIKSGRYGKFLACPGYPECRNTRPITKEMPGVCPLCGGRILARQSKRGRTYYGCEKNPACGFMTWDEPTAEKCPQCGGTLLKKGSLLHCAREGCDYTRTLTRKPRAAKETSP